MASHKSEEMTGSKAGIFLGMLALLIAVVALVLVVIVWAKPEVVLGTDDDDDGGDSNGQISDNGNAGSSKGWDPPGDKDGRPIIFALGYSDPPHEYIDSLTGEHEGFSKDIVKAVCEEMEKKCEFYSYKDYNLCWNEDTWSAGGLANQYFDACAGWVKTVSRARVYEHIAPYAYVKPSRFFVKEDSTLTEMDLATHNIAFRLGFFNNADCVSRILGEEVVNAFEVETSEAGRDGVLDGTYDAFFNSIAVGATNQEGMKAIGEPIHCALANIGLLTRKEFGPSIKGWFEEGLQRIMDNGKYADLCRLAPTVHGSDAQCED